MHQINLTYKFPNIKSPKATPLRYFRNVSGGYSGGGDGGGSGGSDDDDSGLGDGVGSSGALVVESYLCTSMLMNKMYKLYKFGQN